VGSERVQEDSRADESDISEDMFAIAVEVASAAATARASGVVVVVGCGVSAEVAGTGRQPSMFCGAKEREEWGEEERGEAGDVKGKRIEEGERK
jgi:hypothetical protein